MMYTETLKKRGIMTAQPKDNGKNYDLTLPPIDGHKKKPMSNMQKLPSALSKMAAKKPSIARTEKPTIGSGLSHMAPADPVSQEEPAEDTYAAKMERERKSREASRREGLRSRAEEQRFAIE